MSIREEEQNATLLKHSQEKDGVVAEKSQYQKDISKLFENSYPIIPIAEVAEKLSKSKKTIYNWHYGELTRRDLPEQLFCKINGRLFISKEVLVEWLSSMDKAS